MTESIAESPELTLLRVRLAKIDITLQANRRTIDLLSTANAALAMQKSDLLKIVARLTIAKDGSANE